MSPLTQLAAEPAPFLSDADGVLRIGGTRVRLDTVIEAFNQGCSAEEILLKYPSLNLRDIYATITYYLWHPEEIGEYLTTRAAIIERTRAAIEAEFPAAGIRERLLARRPLET